MNVIVVDDERIVLTTETLAVNRVLPFADVRPFRIAKEALAYAEQNKVDIAFLDIDMKDITGLQLAEKLIQTNPDMDIVFCTGYSEYSLEAFNMYCSNYLMKPVTDEKLYQALGNLRHPASLEDRGLRVRCFGEFEVFYDGLPVQFKQKKTKELIAFLIDRHGSTVSTKEITAVLYEKGGQGSFVRNLRADLVNTFESLGVSDVIIHEGNNIGIDLEKLNCDYGKYLQGNTSLFNGEYMAQYSFAKSTINLLKSPNNT